MKLNGKDYEVGKFTRKLNKEYTELSKEVEDEDKKGDYSEELLDKMVAMIVKIFNNKVTEEEINDEWDIADIVVAFFAPQLEMKEKIDTKLKPYEKKFKKK